MRAARPGGWRPSRGRTRRWWPASPPSCHVDDAAEHDQRDEGRHAVPEHRRGWRASRRRPAGGRRRPRPGEQGEGGQRGRGRSTWCPARARSRARRRSARAAAISAGPNRPPRSGNSCRSRWSASRLRNQSRSAARQATAATTKKARKMSSSAVRDITNCEPVEGQQQPGEAADQRRPGHPADQPDGAPGSAACRRPAARTASRRSSSRRAARRRRSATCRPVDGR